MWLKGGAILYFLLFSAILGSSATPRMLMLTPHVPSEAQCAAFFSSSSFLKMCVLCVCTFICAIVVVVFFFWGGDSQFNQDAAPEVLPPEHSSLFSKFCCERGMKSIPMCFFFFKVVYRISVEQWISVFFVLPHTQPPKKT